jgi:hypothetical protein
LFEKRTKTKILFGKKKKNLSKKKKPNKKRTSGDCTKKMPCDGVSRQETLHEEMASTVTPRFFGLFGDSEMYSFHKAVSAHYATLARAKLSSTNFDHFVAERMRNGYYRLSSEDMALLSASC